MSIVYLWLMLQEVRVPLQVWVNQKDSGLLLEEGEGNDMPYVVCT